MKKIISILIAAGVIATVGTVVAVASEATKTDTTIPEKATTEAIPESTTEEVTENAEATTEIVETSTDSNEATNSDATTTGESTDNTVDEIIEEAEIITDENIENSEAVEDDSETVNDEEYPEIPQTGDNRKVFPAIATLLVSGVALAYCLVKGKKIKLKKSKKDGE